MSDIFKGKPTIPLDVFIKMVQTLPPDEIAKLPPEKLPENIPVEIVEDAPIYSRRPLEDLILAANSYHLQRRLDLQSRYGDEVVAALDRSKRASGTANVRVFKNKLKDLEEVFEQYRDSDERRHVDLLTSNVKHVNSLLMDVRTENAGISRDIQILKEQVAELPHEAEDFRRAINDLKAAHEGIEHLLAQYFLIRLQIINREMQEKNRRVNELDQEVQQIQAEIDVLREDLERSQTLWKRALQRGKANQEGEALQRRISQLVAEQKAKEVAISENDLTLWLDTIVDVSLHPFTREQARRVVAEARVALYNLLNRYCMMQEGSAMQIARNPFIQVDAKQAIRFMLLSEQFILDYFSNKRNENTAWISDVAQVKMEDLDHLEKDILSELKRSSRFMKKL
jgi:prefoldin subunit 5